jgi:hypothetical protein
MLETLESSFYSQKKNDSSLETPISFFLISYLLSITNSFSLVEWAYTIHENGVKSGKTNPFCSHGQIKKSKTFSHLKAVSEHMAVYILGSG